MSAAETEAAAIGASDEFQSSPASIVNGYVGRAASMHALVPFRGGEARKSAAHLVRVACLLAAAGGVDRGHVLDGLAQTYADPPA